MKMSPLFVSKHASSSGEADSAPSPRCAASQRSFWLLRSRCSWLAAEEASTPTANDYTAFGQPGLVTVTGYGGDIMEPFISRDGTYLFFNDNGSNKDIYYATYVNATTFQYAGPHHEAINTAAVEGTPTLDVNNKFYYVSPPTTALR